MLCCVVLCYVVLIIYRYVMFENTTDVRVTFEIEWELRLKHREVIKRTVKQESDQCGLLMNLIQFTKIFDHCR